MNDSPGLIKTYRPGLFYWLMSLVILLGYVLPNIFKIISICVRHADIKSPVLWGMIYFFEALVFTWMSLIFFTYKVRVSGSGIEIFHIQRKPMLVVIPWEGISKCGVNNGLLSTIVVHHHGMKPFRPLRIFFLSKQSRCEVLRAIIEKVPTVEKGPGVEGFIKTCLTSKS